MEKKNIYMVGIGGVSMSGIAAILKNFDFNVFGMDDARSANTDKLNKLGIPVTIGTIDETCFDLCDLVVFSAAISNEHKAIKMAKQKNKELIERATFLGYITEHFKDTICIAGTHGKTTTTSMVSLCFLEDNKDPSIQVGATLKQIDGNYKVGNSNYFIIESCEFHESFLHFHPKAEIILNIDNDHLDYYKNLENIQIAFEKFAHLLPNDGILVLNADDENSKYLQNLNNVVTFGIKNNANFMAQNISFNNGFANFDVIYNQKFLANFSLSVPGMHNVYNALSCIALCINYNIQIQSIQKALKKFTGAKRRFEFKGYVNGARIFDDYAHHPTEITATYNAMKKLDFNKSFVIFQPHTYSRTKQHLESFANSLLGFDNIIILDIYAAREKDPGNVSSKLIQKKLKELGKDSIYMPDFSEVEDFIRKNIKKDDILITLGAGSVTNLSDTLANNI